MEKYKSLEIANDFGVLHAGESDSELFYNSRYDLGKHIGVIQEKSNSQNITNKEQHFTLSKMNVITKNITPVAPKINQSQRNFLFINK